MKKYLIATPYFILIILLSAFVIEQGKQLYANTLGYKGEYSHNTGRLSFTNPGMQSAFKGVKAQYEGSNIGYKESPEWKQLILKNREDRSKIEVAGKVITYLISALGLSIYFTRRSKGLVLSWIDWVSVIMGIVFMRDVLINTFNLIIGNMLCQEATLWQQFNLPIFKSMSIYNIVALLLFLVILYKIPKPNRIPFVISGIIGTIIGGCVWFFLVGDLVL